MKSRLPEYFQLDKYSDGPDHIVRSVLCCGIDKISSDVVLAPDWGVRIFQGIADNIVSIVENKVYELSYKNRKVTFIRSGIGAPQIGDVMLSLGCTECRRVILTGSCGALKSNMMIGDLLIPIKAFSGEGFSRYLDTALKPRDCFFRGFVSDENMSQDINRVAESLCAERCNLHVGNVFTTDSILAQFMRLDYIVNKLNCIGIEMEMSAAISAANSVGINVSALLQVSDVIPNNKSLLNERPKDELKQRKWLKEHLLGKIILDSMIGEIKTPQQE